MAFRPEFNQPRRERRARPPRASSARRSRPSRRGKLAAGQRGERDGAEQRHEDERDRRQPDPLDQRALGRLRSVRTRRRVARRLAHPFAQSRQARNRSPAIGEALTEPPPEFSTSTAIATCGSSYGANPMNHECGFVPGSSSAVPDLPATARPAHRRAGSEDPPEVAVDGEPHRRADLARDPRRDDALHHRGRDRGRAGLARRLEHEVRLHEHAVVGDRRGDQGHLQRRDERLALAVAGVRELDAIGEPAAERRRRRS